MSRELRNEDETITGIFIGNQLSFSDTLLNVVNTEIAAVHFMRTASIEETLFATEAQAQAVQMVVIDEALWGNLTVDIARLKAKFGNAGIVLAYRKPELARRVIHACQQAGVTDNLGYLPMNVQLDCWLSALRVLIFGERFLPSELLAPQPGEELPAAPQSSADGPPTDGPDATPTPDTPAGAVGLTERELEVLKAVAEGKQNKIIAEELNLSQHTVKLHIHHVMTKLGTHNRTEAAIWYLGNHTPRVEA